MRVKKYYIRLKHNWQRLDRRYGWRWRAASAGAALLVVFAVAMPVLQHVLQDRRYQLSSAARKLVGDTDQTLSKQLTYDAQTATYQFNKDAVQDKTADNPLTALKQQTGVGDGSKDNKSLYALDVPQDASKGVTYHDINSQLDFTLKPQFKLSTGQNVDGHLVYPMADNSQAIYTLKNNGLKEDIVVNKTSSDTMSFSYDMDLPKTLEARMLPDKSGGIGIYSADPSLFANISYGSDSDKSLVQKARENGEKNFLVFGLPAPVIKTVQGGESKAAAARFELDGSSLKVVAEHLGDITTPFTIDPSVVVTATSDFATSGNNEGMIDFTTANQVQRSELTGGSLGAWSSSANVYPSSSLNYGSGIAAYNGYLYTVGGAAGPSPTSQSVIYAVINSDGTIGSWSTTSSLNTARIWPGVVAYNGYMYAYGGYDGSNVVSGAEYAVINSNGTLGTWVASSNALSSGVCRFGSAVYNGYLYATGGITSPSTGGTCGGGSSTVTAAVQYAPLQGDGSIGTWATTTSFTTARTGHQTVAYNNFLYVISGTVNFSGGQTDVQYAPINSDGTVGSWTASTAIGTYKYSFGAAVYNGYLYLTGGTSGGASSDTTYTQLNGDGTLGSWATTTSFSTARSAQASVAYKGFLYITGGINGSSTSLADTQYAAISAPGTTRSFTTTGNTALSSARTYAASVVYNGYIYVLGGNNGTTVSNASGVAYNDTIYAPLNADGTIGSWSSTSTFNGAARRTAGAATAYNGFMYYLGGSASSPGGSASVETQYVAINSNGSLGTWALTTALPAGRFLDVAWAYNGKMYVAGGFHGSANTTCSTVSSTYCSDVRMSTIAGAGTLGAWSAQAEMNNRRAGHVVVVNAPYVYMLGGDGGGCAIMETGSMTSSGTITSWTATSLTSPFICRTQAMAGYSNGYLYMWGANTSTSSASTTGLYARTADDGTLATDAGCGAKWCATATLSASYFNRTGMVYNGTMYSLGGNDATAATTAVETSDINNGGNGHIKSSWGSTGATIVSSLQQFSVAAANGYLYLAGGYTSSAASPQANVYYAKMNPDGTLGTWTATSSLNTARTASHLIASGPYLYAVAGSNGSTDETSTEYVTIHTDGTLGNWAVATATLGTGMDSGGIAAYQGAIYLVGGKTVATTTGITTVSYAIPSTSTGNFSSWSSGTVLSVATYRPSVVAYNGYLYVIGGGLASSASYSTVAVTAIAGDASLGSWSNTTPFKGAGRMTSAVAYNGYMYIIGGKDVASSTTYADVQKASISNNGNIGSWDYDTAYGSTAVGGDRAYAGNGYLYFLPGTSAGNAGYAPVSSIARVGRYSKLIDLGTFGNITSMTFTGDLPASVANVTYRAARSDGAFGSNLPYYARDPGAGTDACTGTTVNSRYVFATIIIDESTGGAYGGSFADVNGTQSNDQSFTINYNASHPDPSVRLRGGQTLQAGTLGALDTCL